MGLPTQPVTLSVEQVAEMDRKISDLRHDINGHLSLIAATAELMRLKPHMAEAMLSKLVEQPPRISEALRKFSLELEQTLGITRP
jgi:hypothetical protein